jgi:predicted dinucleotide-binding enzyme
MDMTSFTIIGTGNMGGAIGGVLAAGGSDVSHVTREQLIAAPALGDVVVLAVPYGAVDEVIGAYAGQLDGKIVVDITNPLNFETFDSLVVPVGSSAAAEIQAKLPTSKVLKAFNTTFAATLAGKQVGGLPTTVLIAGDDSSAKGALASAITAGGIEAIDAGSLARAHELEALGFLQLTLAVGEKISWTGGFAVAR